MLLQKREENAIALAATANNAKIIDEAIADDIPVSPKRRMIYLIALVLGIGIPVGIIYLIGLTKFKLEGRADVEKLTTIPIVGDIPLTDEKNEKDGSIADPVVVRGVDPYLDKEALRVVKSLPKWKPGNQRG